MAEPTNIEQVVDDLSKPGNEAALEKALQNDFEQVGEPANNNSANSDPINNQPPATDQPPVQNQQPPAQPPAQQPPAQEPPANQPPASNDQPPAGNEPTNQDPAGNQTPPTDDKTSNFKDLLSDRNAARQEAADAQTEAAARAKRIADLEAENARLKQGNEGGEPGTPGDPTDNLEGKDIKTLIKEGVDEALKGRDQVAEAEKSDVAEIEKLTANQATPHAKDFTKEIGEVMKAHPTMSALAAYRMLQGAGTIPADGGVQVNSNSQQLDTGNRTRVNLQKTKKASDMSDAEMEAHLQKEQSAGRLNI